MIAAIYARKSTEQAGAGDKSESVERQRAHARAYATMKGRTIADAHVYADDGIVGAEAEDVVHDVTLYLLEKRDYLRDAPGAAYFLTAVKNGALRRLLYASHRYTVFVDPETLVLIEAMAHPARVRRSNTTVRLPEPVG
jgi:DNA-directed RNA polymerase specialized sigma24 family protein